jgi:hypothetical protein
MSAKRSMSNAFMTFASAELSFGHPLLLPSRPTRTFSATVRLGNSCGSWWTTATRRQSMAGVQGSPLKVSSPSSGRSSPAMTRTRVLFPAPLGPATPRISPGRISRSRPASATVAPYRFCKPRRRMPALPPFMPPCACGCWSALGRERPRRSLRNQGRAAARAAREKAGRGPVAIRRGAMRRSSPR